MFHESEATLNTHFRFMTGFSSVLIVLTLSFLSPAVLADRYRYPLGDISQAELFERHDIFSRNFAEHETPPPLLGLPDDLEVTILFGTWCHDSEREVPKMLKLLAASGVQQKSISLIALDIRKEEPRGRAKALGVTHTPTFVFFSDDVELGRIVERPAVSLEHAIQDMLSR